MGRMNASPWYISSTFEKHPSNTIHLSGNWIECLSTPPRAALPLRSSPSLELKVTHQGTIGLQTIRCRCICIEFCGALRICSDGSSGINLRGRCEPHNTLAERRQRQFFFLLCFLVAADRTPSLPWPQGDRICKP